MSTADVRDALSGDTLTFFLPGESDTLLAHANQVDENNRIGFQWYGKLINASGYVMFNHKNGLTSGYILKGTDVYALLPIDSNFQFLIQQSSNPPENVCGIPEVLLPPDITGPTPDCEYTPGYNTCPAVITVLVIIDEFAKSYLETLWGGVDFFLFFGEAIVNQAFYNSDIPNKEIRIKHIEKNGFNFSNPISILDDLDELRTWSQQDRTDHKADLVVLLTGEQYPGGIFGVATLDGAPSFDRSFAITEAAGFINAAGFPHELGHLFGCRHNWKLDLGNDNTEICAHAYRHLAFFNPPPEEPWELPSIKSWRTILGVTINAELLQLNEQLYHWNEEGWILHYSNPYVNYYGTATGRPPVGAVTDNAQQIRNAGCDVADFFPNQELGIFIDYTPQGCDQQKTFSANIIMPESGLPGMPPYTISWYSNNSGVFQYPGQNVQFLGTGASITLNQHPHCPVYWIKCIVQSSDNVVVSRIIRIDLGSVTCCSDEPGGGSNSEFSSSANEINLKKNDPRSKEICIYPSPFYGSIINIGGIDNSHIYNYVLLDIAGKIIAQGDFSCQIGQDSVRLKLPGMESGIYIMNITSNTHSIQTRKIIAIK